jgi:hypothetical protein
LVQLLGCKAYEVSVKDRRAKSRDEAGASNCGKNDVVLDLSGVPDVSSDTEELELSPSKLSVLKLCGVAVGETVLRLFGETDGEHGKLPARFGFRRGPLKLFRLFSIAPDGP